MTVSDGIYTVELGEAQVEIGNAPPVVASATLLPAPATSADDLGCLAGPVTDPDGHPTTLHYAWTFNGADPGIDAPAIPSQTVARGTVVRCSAWANDGWDDGPPVVSDEITLGNAIPGFSDLLMNPPTPTVASGAQALALVFDADGDTVYVDADWRIDGVTWGFWDNQDPSSLHALPPYGAWRGQEVELWARRDDNIEVSAWSVIGPVTVANSPPDPPQLSVDPAVPLVTQDVRCEIGPGADPDGDTVTFSISWTVDGQPWSGATSTTLRADDTIPLGQLGDGAVVQCSVLWDDGWGGTGTTVATATVGGTGPCAGGRDDLWVVDLPSGSGYSDIANAISWTADGILLVGDQRTSASAKPRAPVGS
jgi:hypothetical protein